MSGNNNYHQIPEQKEGREDTDKEVVPEIELTYYPEKYHKAIQEKIAYQHHQSLSGGDLPEVVLRLENQNLPPQVISPSDTDKIVSHGAYGESPQVHDLGSPLYAVPVPDREPPTPVGLEDEETTVAEDEPKPESTNERRGILGLDRTTFALLIVLALVILGGAIGGGVGGGIATSNHKKEVENAQAAGAGSSGSSGNPTGSADPAENTPTDYYEKIHYRLQLWEGYGFSGRSYNITHAGVYKFDFKIHSYYWSPGLYTNEMRCSMGICLGEDLLGWRGADTFQQVGDLDWSFMGDTAIVNCGKDFQTPICPNPTGYAYQTTSILSSTTLIRTASPTHEITWTGYTNMIETSAPTTTSSETTTTTTSNSEVKRTAIAVVPSTFVA